jgi:hypothetical protein
MGNPMHENNAYNAIQRALMRMLPDLGKSPEGRAELEKIVLEIMNEVREAGLRYVNARGE